MIEKFLSSFAVNAHQGLVCVYYAAFMLCSPLKNKSKWRVEERCKTWHSVKFKSRRASCILNGARRKNLFLYSSPTLPSFFCSIASKYISDDRWKGPDINSIRQQEQPKKKNFPLVEMSKKGASSSSSQLRSDSPFFLHTRKPFLNLFPRFHLRAFYHAAPRWWWEKRRSKVFFSVLSDL